MSTVVEAALGTHVQRNAPSKLAVASRVSTALLADLLLDVHEAVLDPGAELDVGAHGLRVEELRKGELDLLIDFAEPVGVLDGSTGIGGSAGEGAGSAG